MVVAVPTMGLSVLLPEISKDLNLCLIQAGLLWGIGSLPIIFSSILSGMLIDRFGPKRIIITACLLSGLTGASRGFSTNFIFLMVTVFLFGLCTPLVMISNLKSAKVWFLSHEFGMANGILALGMGSGFFIGSMVSATFISPWLGGWRNVFIFYGLIAVGFMIPWFFTHPVPSGLGTPQSATSKESFRQSIRYITRIKNIWLLGLAFLSISGGVQGFLGYLPTYLRNLGWQEISADSVTASFHLASMLCVIPITRLSNKYKTRRKIVIGAASLTAISTGLLSFLSGGIIWVAVILAGVARDAVMSLITTMNVETKGIGSAYAGIASGFIMIFSGVGNLVAPPLGNKLAGIGLGTPFIFWAALGVIGVIFIASLKETQTLPIPNQDNK